MKKGKRIRVEQFLFKYKDLFKIAAIERNLDFSRGTIAKFYRKKYNRKLTSSEISRIDQLIQRMYDDYYSGTEIS